MTRFTTRLASLASMAALAGSLAFAQQTPPPAPPAPDQSGQPHPGGRMQGGPGGPMGQGMHPRDGRGGDPRGGREGRGMQGGNHGRDMQGRGGMHGAPMGGMWWKNPELATRVGLTPEQITRMDSIFQSSRIQLIDLKANVEKQEVMLQPMMEMNPVDTKRALAQIGKVADARAELEKANGGMLLGIRSVLTADQWTKLHAGGHRGMGAPGAPGAPGMPPHGME